MQVISGKISSLLFFDCCLRGGFGEFYSKIAGEKDCTSYKRVVEFFSEETLEMCVGFLKPGCCFDDDFTIRVSPGKAEKNLVKVYFLEMPLDYAIFEVDDIYFEKLNKENKSSVCFFSEEEF